MGPIMTFSDLIRALWRRAWLILAISFLGSAASLWYAWTRPHSWESTAIIQIEGPRVATALAGSSETSTATMIDLVKQQIMSRDNILRLIEEFEPFPPALSETEQVGGLREAVAMNEIIDSAMAWRPDVQPTGLAITVELGDPQVAADVANAIVASIVDEAQLRVDDRVTSTLDFLLSEEARIREEIAGIEEDIAAFRQTHLASLPEGLTAQRERLADLNATLLAIDQDLLALDNATARQRPEEVERQRRLLTERRALLAENATEIAEAIAATPGVERELGAMTRKLGQFEAELSVITARRTEAAMTQLLETQERTTRLIVLEEALPAEYPSSRSRKLIALAGGMASVMVALAVALALELTSQGIRTAAQMRRELGVDPVIVIPRLERKTRRGGLWRWGAGLVALILGAAAAVRLAGIDRVAGLLPRDRAVPDRLRIGMQPAE